MGSGAGSGAGAGDEATGCYKVRRHLMNSSSVFPPSTARAKSIIQRDMIERGVTGVCILE